MSPRFTWILAVLLPACGSRSGFLDVVAADGTGTSDGGGGLAASSGVGGSTGITGGAGQGGVGGKSACTELALVEPVLAIASEPQIVFDDSLAFAPSSDDGTQITATFLRQLEGAETQVHHATLSPWKSWPVTGELGPQHATSIEVEASQTPSRAPGGRFALAADQTDGISFFSGLDPGASGSGPLAALPIDGNNAEFAVPRSLGLSGPTHLIGSYDSVAGILGTVVTAGEKSNGSVVLGCAAVQPARVAAVPFEDGWLAAVSNGSPEAPGCTTASPGYPKRIDVLRIGPDASIALEVSISTTDVVVTVGMAPHPDGAYVVWWQSPQGPGPAALRGARLDATTSSLVGPVDLALPDEIPGQMVVTAVGRLLAVARSSAPPSTPSGLVLSVHDEALGLTASTSYSPPNPSEGPSSAIGSPDGDGVLVGWTSFAESQPSRVRLARFDCGP